MVENVGHLFRDRVRIDRDRHAADRLDRREAPVEARPVRPDHRDAVAAPDADRLQPDRERAHLVELFLPGPALPDAVILVTHRRPIAEALRIEQEILRERIGGSQCFCQTHFLPPLRHHAPRKTRVPDSGSFWVGGKFPRIRTRGNNALDRHEPRLPLSWACRVARAAGHISWNRLFCCLGALLRPRNCSAHWRRSHGSGRVRRSGAPPPRVPAGSCSS